jgi:hypothetical protein
MPSQFLRIFFAESGVRRGYVPVLRAATNLIKDFFSESV